jgi:hypothetical protein
MRDMMWGLLGQDSEDDEPEPVMCQSARGVRSNARGMRR